ncbi:MAG: LamG domain-containing protein [Anaerolineae bacterium]|nr:LamG domain-containing protein [Anaerolineae bacterium]
MQLLDTLSGVALLRRNPSPYQSYLMQLSPLGWWSLDEDSGVVATNRMYVQSPGPELLSNGDFATWISDNPFSWDVLDEVAPNYVLSERDPSQLSGDTPTIGGAANFVTDTSYKPRIFHGTLTPGHTYDFEWFISAAGQGNLMLYSPASVVTTGAVGTYIRRRVTTTTWVAIAPVAVPCDMTVDYVSVRKVGEMDGTVKGTTTMSVDGASPRTGSAYAFDGATSALEVIDSRLHGLDELTLMMLVNLDSAGEANNGHLMYKSGEFTWRVLPSGQIECVIQYGTTNAQAISATGAYTTGAWAWLTCRIGADAVPHLYVNEVEVSYATQTTGSGSRTAGTGSLFIGNDSGQLATLDGAVDEVLLFDRALTDGEIAFIVERSGI